MRHPSITSYGGVQHITGSAHIYTGSDGYRLGIDMGGVQGYGVNIVDNSFTGMKSSQLPQDVVVTHAHYDHCGRLPILMKEGFSGTIWVTEKTKQGIMTTLRDSLKIMEREIGYRFKKDLSELKKSLSHQLRFVNKHADHITSGTYNYEHEQKKRIAEMIQKKVVNVSTSYLKEFAEPEEVLAEYQKNLEKYGIVYASDITKLDISDKYIPRSQKELDKVYHSMQAVAYQETKQLTNTVSITLYDAGHILGSAQVLIHEALYGKTLFTGDLGRLHSPLYLKPPHLFTPQDNIKNMIIEATYGGREHAEREQEDLALLAVIAETKGPILWANFANQRHTDDLQKLYTWQKEYSFIPNIIADGITAKEFLQQRIGEEGYEDITNQQYQIKRAPQNHQDKIDAIKNKRCIILSSSGMLSAGPIQSYLHVVLQNEEGLLVIPGFQAPGTVGERILKNNEYKHQGQIYTVKAKIFHCAAKSSHAGQKDLHTILHAAEPQHAVIVHGPDDQKGLLAERIKDNDIAKQVTIPQKEGVPYRLA